MADYRCPRCDGVVTRAQHGAVARQFGLVGALIGMAAAGFECASCGKIEKSEFPPDVRSQMGRGSIMMVVGAIFVLGALIALLAALS